MLGPREDAPDVQEREEGPGNRTVMNQRGRWDQVEKGLHQIPRATGNHWAEAGEGVKPGIT